jgi:uncharacterized damage-inducible protein DinB
MPSEAAQIASVIERIARDIIAKIENLPDEVLNQPMPVPDANTIYALATHTVGMGEFWVLALVGGRTIVRNRAAEFRAQGSGRALVARYQQWIDDVHTVLDDLPASALDERAEPPVEFRMTGGLGEETLTRRDCLLHVVEHSATHLGHIQLTCDLFQTQ